MGNLITYRQECSSTTRALMEMDVKNIFDHGVFTFLLGQEGKRFDVHVAIIRNLSPPLAALMTNGRMIESIHKEAKLEDVDAVTFALFLEYAYSGTYRIPPEPILFRKTEHAVGRTSPPTGYHCNHCSIRSSESTDYPFCSITCGLDAHYMMWKISPGSEYNSYCCYCSRSSRHISHTGKRALLCGRGGITCEKISSAERQKYLHAKTYLVQAEGAAGLAEFEGRKYPTLSHSHASLSLLLMQIHPPDRVSNNLVAHAQLWVFADMYMVTELKELCLHKLHRDLLAFNLSDSTISRLIELLSYVYNNTSNDAKDGCTVQHRLRDLVVSYAAIEAEFLLEHPSFKETLTGGGDLVADFVTLLGKQLKLR